jgi:hypothetical protein
MIRDADESRSLKRLSRHSLVLLRDTLCVRDERLIIAGKILLGGEVDFPKMVLAGPSYLHHKLCSCIGGVHEQQN